MHWLCFHTFKFENIREKSNTLQNNLHISYKKEFTQTLLTLTLLSHRIHLKTHIGEKSNTLTIGSFLTKWFAQTLWPILLEFHCIHIIFHPHHALKSMNSFTPVIIYVNVSNEYELVLDLFILVWTTGWAKKHAVVSSSSYHAWMCMKVIRRLLSRGLLLSVYATQLYYSTTPFCINTI